ncbi:MAG: hypothetical protein WDM85_18435 [Caulobacteraceae bacterium]
MTINQEAWMQTRHIWTDGRPHPTDPEPGYFGDSVGHWEGGTLVADTIAIKDDVPPHHRRGPLRQAARGRADPPEGRRPGHPDRRDHGRRPRGAGPPLHRRRDLPPRPLRPAPGIECSENNRNPVDQNGDTEFK